ncbi:MAG: tetratricopeptide repeat protein, partial [Chitinophagaceae bacterium]|nr:tetratricopeptide repeat protein [Chitinophagaceae bacterium]
MKNTLLLLAFFIKLLAANGQTFIELNDQYNALYKKGAYKEAVTIGIKALAQAKIEYGTEHENYAIISHNLAEGYYALKEWKQALPLYHQAVKVYAITAKTNETIDIALCNNSIGNIYLVQKKYDSSAIFFESSFNYFLKNSEAHYNNAIGVMNNLYDLYVPLKRYKEAKNVFTKMLPVIETKEGTMSANFKAVFANLATMLDYLEDYATLEIWYKKIMPSVQKEKGKLSKEYGDMAYQLGSYLKKLNKKDEAILYLKEANHAFRAVAGNIENGEIALRNNDIGLLYMDLTKYDSASVYLEKSFNYFILNAATEYENAITLMTNLEGLYMPLLKHEEAKAMYSKILPVIEKK